MQSNTCSLSQVLILNHVEHFFIFVSKVNIQFFFSGQYFKNNNNNNNMPPTLARHPPHPCYTRQHAPHATHASTLPTLVRHTRKHVTNGSTSSTQAHHPRHTRQHEQHAISQTLQVSNNQIRIQISHLQHTKNKIDLSLRQRIAQFLITRNNIFKTLKSCLIQRGRQEEVPDYTMTKLFSPSSKSQNESTEYITFAQTYNPNTSKIKGHYWQLDK